METDDRSRHQVRPPTDPDGATDDANDTADGHVARPAAAPGHQPDDPVVYRYVPLLPTRGDGRVATTDDAPSAQENSASAGADGYPTPARSAWPEPFEAQRPPTPPTYGGYATGDARRFGAPEEGAPPSRGNPLLRLIRWGWPLLLLLLTKAKYLAFLLKFKVFGTFATMLVSLAVYAVAFGLPFAIGFIALLFIHEMGHAIVLKQQGVRATAPLFIPFMGAFIGMKEMPKNVYNEAKMALGGPVLGSLGALACLVLWQTTGSPLFLALTYVGCWLNLFNLIPVSPLDGGRAMAAISPYGWLLGLALLLLLFVRLQSFFLGFILVVGGIEVFQRWRGRHDNPEYYTLTGRQRLLVAATYFGLAALLALATAALEPQLLYHRPAR